MNRLLLVTDAWTPQTNGVVTTMKRMVHHLEKLGVSTIVVEPGRYRTLSLPGYREIRVAWNLWGFLEVLRRERPNSVHIATEGPLGLMARNCLVTHGVPFTTSLHTRFPEYINERIPLIPVNMGYRYMRWFHSPSAKTLVTTASIKSELSQRGFDNLEVWGRGVDTELFKPSDSRDNDSTEPLLLYVGRVSVEKNLEDFLEVDHFGRKVVVGDGPCLKRLKKEYPEVLFTGYKYGVELAKWYADADVFVFPSRTDTFGLVMLEAMACGTPVAAYPVTGPIDVVREGENGALDDDLRMAVKRALKVSRARCREYALSQNWDQCADIFLRTLVYLK